MAKKKKNLPFIEISPSEFENLCHDLLLKEYPSYALKNVAGCRDEAVDLKGTFKDSQGKVHTIAVECKMAAHIPFRNFEAVISRILKSNPEITKIILMIASYVSPRVRHELIKLAKTLNIEIEIMAEPQLNNLLFKHQDIIYKYFNQAFINVDIRNRKIIWSSLLGVLSILMLLIFYLKPFTFKTKELLENKITTVNNAIENLKGLENYLKDIKNDIEKTQIAKEKIEKEYVDSQKLKALTQEQIASISSALEKGSLTKMIWNLVFGFILGIASSVLGNIFWDWYIKKRKQQAEIINAA